MERMERRGEEQRRGWREEDRRTDRGVICLDFQYSKVKKTSMSSSPIYMTSRHQHIKEPS